MSVDAKRLTPEVVGAVLDGAGWRPDPNWNDAEPESVVVIARLLRAIVVGPEAEDERAALTRVEALEVETIDGDPFIERGAVIDILRATR